ncbi:MAG: hypothetical protein JW841_11075 [Deltaproteobacteria bacterium]|nr:hypothetical protein [Deltaproteobacteria bacterium]
MATTSILLRLMQGDVVTTSFYQTNLSVVPYYLYYIFALPLVALFGVLSGTKITITLFAGAFLAASWLILLKRKRAWFIILLAPLFITSLFFMASCQYLRGCPQYCSLIGVY